MVITQVEPIAVLFTLPEDALRTVLPRIRAGARLPVDAFDRSGATRLASGSVLTLDNQIDQTTGTVRLKAVRQPRPCAVHGAVVNIRSSRILPLGGRPERPCAWAQGPVVYVMRTESRIRPGRGTREDDRRRLPRGSNRRVVVTAGTDRLTRHRGEVRR